MPNICFVLCVFTVCVYNNMCVCVLVCVCVVCTVFLCVWVHFTVLYVISSVSKNVARFYWLTIPNNHWEKKDKIWKSSKFRTFLTFTELAMYRYMTTDTCNLCS